MPETDRPSAACALELGQPDTAVGEIAVAPADSGPQHDARGSVLTHHLLETLQTVLTALILAFVFRAYLIEAFIIPTGSMAESLLGEHGAHVCPSCGWEYDFGPTRTGYAPGQAFLEDIEVACPNCHATTYLKLEQIAPKAGDRILVHKWPYVLGGSLAPRRWDVIVFKDPHDPAQNFIKRLVALPGDQIQIVDGDIYIRAAGEEEFHIARKTAAAQSVLWFVVFDQSHLPTASPTEPIVAPWVSEDDGENRTAAGWSGLDSRMIQFASADAAPHAIRFAPTSDSYLQDVYGYNRGPSDASTGGPPLVGDVRMRASVDWRSADGSLCWKLRRDDHTFAATLTPEGYVLLTLRRRGVEQEVELARTQSRHARAGERFELEFGHLDYRVYVAINGHEVLATTDLQYAPKLDELQGTRRVAPVELRIVARGGAFALRDLRIDRDVYYLSPAKSRARPGDPFKLGPREYFVLGDNSPHSHDGRSWETPPDSAELHPGELGPHLRPRFARGEYHVGTVAADQVVGRAFFVYLPGLLSADERSRWRAVPDIGRSRFVR